MPTRKAPVLERILVVMIIYGLILFALHIYDYLVRVYESHWVQHPAVTCVDNVRWAPIGPQQVTEQLEAFQTHAWSTLPARGLETLFLFSRDRHASGVVYLFEPVNSTEDVEVEVLTSYGSEGTPQERRTVCTLRRSRGERRIGVLVAAAAPLARYDATEKDDDTLKITVWLPEGPRSEADVIFVLQLETDLITQLRRERVIDDRHRSCTPSQDTPIEIDLDFMTGSLRTGISALAGAFNCGKVEVSPSRYGCDTPPLDDMCSAHVAESMLCSTHRTIPDQRPYLAYGDSFDLLSATVRLTVDVTIDAEDPAGV
ncbi:hypothetical protein BGW80DRAFT_1458716 [Lactifluus volemus]|nr:hypothetical protein BGW80DRAFT_1458716 [Lactifluus volemus]